MPPADPRAVVGIAAVLAVLAMAVPLVFAKLVSPRNPGREKQRPYECGVIEKGDSWRRFKVQYYLYALVFLVFDVEVLFLYPWAVVLRDAGVIGLAEMFAFLGLLLVAWLYALKHGALEWE